MGNCWDWEKKDYITLEKEFAKLSEFVLTSKHACTDIIIDPLSSMLQKIKSDCNTIEEIYCYAGRNMTAITPQGDIFPCHRFAFMKFKQKVKIGNIFNGNIDNSILKRIKNKQNGNNNVCEKCKARTLCENQCIAMNLLINQDLFAPQSILCEITKIVARTARRTYLECCKGGL